MGCCFSRPIDPHSVDSSSYTDGIVDGVSPTPGVTPTPPSFTPSVTPNTMADPIPLWMQPPPMPPPMPPPFGLGAQRSSPQGTPTQPLLTYKHKVANVPFTEAERTNGTRVTIWTAADTHNSHDSSRPPPDCSIFIHAGDYSIWGTADEARRFEAFMASLPVKHRIVVFGNHDKWSFSDLRKILKSCIVLHDSEVTVEGIRIFGCAWRGKYDKIPEGVDIVVSHQPTVGAHDIIYSGTSVGSTTLRKRVDVIKPRVFVCGHNHEGYGVKTENGTTFINSSVCIGGANSSIRRVPWAFDFYVNPKPPVVPSAFCNV